VDGIEDFTSISHGSRIDNEGWGVDSTMAPTLHPGDFSTKAQNHETNNVRGKYS
jgi:hypothetical protein